MKILIVDDEKLTQEGIVSSIDWNALNIEEVYQAADGIEGLEMARKYRPDLILSDIRMPRMDGIAMAEELQAILPDSSIIFMSGYSDKHYLKAAIKLKVISYIEKPIDLLEVENAIMDAIQNNEQLLSARYSRELNSQNTHRQLALELTYPGNEKICRELSDQLGLIFKSTTVFTTFIIKTITPSEEITGLNLEELNRKFEILLKSYHLSFIHGVKQNQYLLYHIYGDKRSSAGDLMKLAQFLKRELGDRCRYFIAIGKSQTGPEKAYHSYTSAVVLLQSSFFHPYNSILRDMDKSSCTPLLGDPVPAFSEALLTKDRDLLSRLKDDIYQNYVNTCTLLPSQVKDVYYKLLMYIQNTYKQLKLSSEMHSLGSESILDNIEKCHTLLELHLLLEDKLEEFFSALEHTSQDSSTIFLIKEFIHQNYMMDSLSVKTISEHVYLSSSYVCTVFKTETGQTLNQYITEYRIARAKLLLEDPRHKITEVSARVGYSDGNYFGKSFKKSVGLSPSEYREKMLS